MKNKYNIYIKPSELSEEEIEKHKDFDALMAQMDKQPLIKRSFVRKLLPLVATLAAAVVLFFVVTIGLKNTPSSDGIADLSPLPAIEKKTISYKINGEIGDTLLHANGSKIIFPPAAFVFEDGSQVEGEIDVEYEEFQDVVDVFLSGYPSMKVEGHTVNSSGMLKVKGRQNGKPVFVAEGKVLNVELKSQLGESTPLAGYNVYRFDQKKLSWLYKGRDKVRLIKDYEEWQAPVSSEERLDEIRQKMKELESGLQEKLNRLDRTLNTPAKPKAPVRANPNNYVFDLDFDEKEFPELNSYKDISWEVTSVKGGGEFNPDWYVEEWSDMALEKTGKSYQLKLMNNAEVVTLEVSPVMSESKFIDAQRIYQELIRNYEQVIANQGRNKERTVELLKKDFEAEMTGLRAEEAYWVNSTVKREILNIFSIDQFGVWNCARSEAINKLWTGKVTLKSEDNEVLDFDQIYIANSETRSLYIFNRGEPIYLNPTRDHFVWVVKGKYLAYRKLKANDASWMETVEWQMKSIEVDNLSENKLRETILI